MCNIGKLIKKELIFLVGTMRPQFIIILFFITVLPMISPSLSSMGAIIVPYFAIYGAMAYEERGKGDYLVATLPVKRSEICWAKYLLGIIYTIVGVVCSLIFVQIGSLILPESLRGVWETENIVLLGVTLSVLGILYTALMIPILLKVGVEKSRYVMFVLYIIIFIASSGLGGVLKEIGIEGLILTLNPSLLIMLGGLLGIVGYTLSFIFSLHLLKTKEFY